MEKFNLCLCNLLFIIATLVIFQATPRIALADVTSGTNSNQISIENPLGMNSNCVEPVNLIDNGVDYANWTVSGIGTTKSATGIHLANDGITETAKLSLPTLEPNSLYVLTIEVSDYSSSGYFVTNPVLTGAHLMISGTGVQTITIATSPTLEDKTLWFFISGGTPVDYADFKVISLCESTGYAISGKPSLLFTFDDGWDTQYTKAFNYMHTKGQKGTIYLIPALVNTPGKVTKKQCDKMYSAGWCMANHTYDHPYMGEFTKEQSKEAILQGMVWLSKNGYSTGVSHLSFPGGQYNDNVLTGAKELEVKTARTVVEGLNDNIIPDLYQLTELPFAGGAYTLDQIKSQITSSISSGKTCIILVHKIVDTVEAVDESGMNTLYSDFQALSDWVATQDIDVLTMDEWYNTLTLK